MKILFLSMLSLFGLLTLTSSNNLYEAPVEIVQSDSIELEQAIKHLRKVLIQPISDCYLSQESHMSKCPDKFEIELKKVGWRNMHSNDLIYKMKFAEHQAIRGNLLFRRCGMEGDHVSSFVLIWKNDKTILLKENFRSKEVPLKEYIASFCKEAAPKKSPRRAPTLNKAPKKEQEKPSSSYGY